MNLALTGGMFQAIAHAFAKAAMFMAAGLIAEALGHDRIAGLRGIGRALPVTSFAFGIAALSLIGVPPTGGFVVKWWLLTASATTGQSWWVVVILAGGLLAGGYMFRVLGPLLADGKARWFCVRRYRGFARSWCWLWQSARCSWECFRKSRPTFFNAGAPTPRR